MLSRAWHLHQKTTSGQRGLLSPPADGPRRTAAFAPLCLSCCPLGRLVTHSASPSVDPMATEPSGHGESGVHSPIFLIIFPFLACRASALASDAATTVRTQCTTTHSSIRRDNDLWTLSCVCPEPRFASRLSSWGARDEASPRPECSRRESLSAHFRTHISHGSSFYHSRSMILCSFPLFVPLSFFLTIG
jgi:hypothetical protein